MSRPDANENLCQAFFILNGKTKFRHVLELVFANFNDKSP